MGKRSDLPRRDKDKYYTPIEAVRPLIPHLPEYANFCEPCCGDGRLIKHIEKLTNDGVACVYASDISPDFSAIQLSGDFWLPLAKICATDIVEAQGDMFITNPPYKWEVLKPLLDHLPSLKPTWLLLPADLMHNKRMAPYMKVCKKVVSVGRVKWIEGTKASSTDNFAWYLFDNKHIGPTVFVGRDVE